MQKTLKSTTDARRKPGFALIATLSIMVLLVLLSVGLLSLSTVALRSSASVASTAEAQANARLALALALGELQKAAGPDQRITAAAGILNDSAQSSSQGNPYWTGVWNSWTARTDNKVDEVSEHSTIASSGAMGMHPTYQKGREDHFRRWLVSGDVEITTKLETATSSAIAKVARPSKDDDSVLLVGDGTLGKNSDSSRHVATKLMRLNENGETNGRVGWWVGDESLKAAISPDPYADEAILTNALAMERSQAPAQSATWKIEGLEHALDPELASKAVSRLSFEVPSPSRDLTKAAFHDVTPASFGVLADVREGGLKRDLAAILDRPINTREQGDEFMLYKFKEGENERVPIQDLSAYYQLYRDQLKTRSLALRSGEQIIVPDYQKEDFERNYSSLHRMPVPVKVQFLLSRIGRNRTQQDRSKNPSNTDPYKLHIGITPSITLWNPYNVPLVMEPGATRAMQLRYFNMPLSISWNKNGGQFISKETSLSWITNRERSDGGDRYTGFTGWLAGTSPVVFQPGEVRIFSLRSSSKEIINSNKFKTELEMVPGWNPETFIELTRSAEDNNKKHVDQENLGGNNRSNIGGPMTFKDEDTIEFTVNAAGSSNLADGSAIQFFLRQGIAGGAGSPLDWNDRNYNLISRPNGNASGFNLELMKQAFPENMETIEFKGIPGGQMKSGRPQPFLLVSLTAASEVGSEFANDEDGRRFISRPFLHSSAIHAAPLLDRSDRDALYQHGWNWWVSDVNSSLEASVQVASDNRTSYYGGGYTSLFGSRHVIQQEIPMTPPMSIAALSHARLGGWSLATGKGGATSSNNTTASGGGGLYPHTLQAIGNSYAHPYIEADSARTTWDRLFNTSGRPTQITLADHSYLANKALWDEFFISSIAPRNTSIYGASGGSAKQTALDAFVEGKHLPNRRLMPIHGSITESELDDYFDGETINEEGEQELAEHLLVRGAFNINSTSVEAWKAVFSSLKSKEVANTSSIGSNGIKVETTSMTGTPVSQFTTPNGDSYNESSKNPSDPDQWLGWRELDETEIEQLAEAMVEQVRKRGPFLSLSEFINRRLDNGDKELSLKGALQAALDDEDVDINAGFRTPERRITDISGMNPAFPEALEGPVAYGSAAYIDQADLLRNIGNELTPRGDTFLIRTYGDSLDAAGNVIARAWCEAVVQRSTTYLDRTDDAWTSQEELQSPANRNFGRPFNIVSFRWLSPNEV